jgi:drug/metabolite transporter (DMT)-like permease
MVWSITWVSAPLAMVVAAVWLKEPISPGRWMAAATGLAGVWMMLGAPLPKTALDAVLALGVAGCFGLYLTQTRALRTEHTSTNLVHTALWVFLALSVIMPFVWLPMSTPVLVSMILVGAWGLGMLLMLDRSLACAPVSVVAPFACTESLWGLLNAWLRHGEAPGTLRLTGMALLAGMGAWIVGSVWFDRSPDRTRVTNTGPT